MLTIRPAQFAVLWQVEVRKFEKWMLVHLKRFFPAQCTAAGDIRLQEMIQHGIERAAAYGITAKRDVCKYIDLMAVFGSEFDTDSRTRWAHRGANPFKESVVRRRLSEASRMLVFKAARPGRATYPSSYAGTGNTRIIPQV